MSPIAYRCRRQRRNNSSNSRGYAREVETRVPVRRQPGPRERLCVHHRSRAGADLFQGQPISAAYEGWEVDPTARSNHLRIREQELGRGDGSPGWAGERLPTGSDRSRSAHALLPAAKPATCSGAVPSQFNERDELVWTLITHGRTSKAYASLRPDLILDDVAKGNDTGASGMSSSPEPRANKPPVVEIEGSKTRTVKVGQPLVLVAKVTDDGVPKATTEEQARNRARRNVSTTTGAEAGSSATAVEARVRAADRSRPPARRLNRSISGALLRSKAASVRATACISRGSTFAARARCNSTHHRSRPGKICGSAPTRRGRRSASPRRCRPTAG